MDLLSELSTLVAPDDRSTPVDIVETGHAVNDGASSGYALTLPFDPNIGIEFDLRSISVRKTTATSLFRLWMDVRSLDLYNTLILLVERGSVLREECYHDIRGILLEILD